MIERTLYNSVGARFKIGRQSKGLTLEEVAKGSGLGLSRSAISSIEQGKQQISLHQFLRLTKMLDLPSVEIITDMLKSMGDGKSTVETALHKRPKTRSLIETV